MVLNHNGIVTNLTASPSCIFTRSTTSDTKFKKFLAGRKFQLNEWVKKEYFEHQADYVDKKKHITILKLI